MKEGAPVNATAVNDCTPLLAAVTKGHVTCAEILIKAGADVNVTTGEGNTALHMASYCGSSECVSLLLRNNIQINKINGFDDNSLEMFPTNVINSKTISPTTEEVATLLHAAGETYLDLDVTHILAVMKKEEIKRSLKHSCRESIRGHMLSLDAHHHLFGRIPLLPSLIEYLLYGFNLEGASK